MLRCGCEGADVTSLLLGRDFELRVDGESRRDGEGVESPLPQQLGHRHTTPFVSPLPASSCTYPLYLRSTSGLPGGHDPRLDSGRRVLTWSALLPVSIFFQPSLIRVKTRLDDAVSLARSPSLPARLLARQCVPLNQVRLGQACPGRCWRLRSPLGRRWSRAQAKRRPCRSAAREDRS